MCGGGGGDGGASEREAARQANIKAGYEQIQKIFNGYSSGSGDVSDYVPGQKYYTKDGQEVTYATQIKKNDPLEGLSSSERRLYLRYNNPEPTYETIRGYSQNGNFVPLGNADKLYSGVTKTPGFDEDFYNQRAQAYTDYATPQLNDQYADAVKSLTFALARNGRLNSSTAGDEKAKLQKKYDEQKIALADKARGYGEDARTAVENSRSGLVTMNSNMADPNAIASEATSRLSGLQALPSFSPLAALFTNVGETLGTQADLERRSQARYNTGLFTPSAVSNGASSGKVIN